eukprot:TRINITY_DN61642_c1_g1_i1.p1 TRINITY_DN61642_c1_g1~~TRINITY_DN61642_c1_g1_i1.p1  ORF type:complete len:871 (-),score=30.84 TRINITY_DN61642_c1_g1_i1:130-2721(-)
MEQSECVFRSLGCNKVAHCSDWNSDGLYAYGGGTLLSLWRPSALPYQSPHSTLSVHKDRINAVKWIRPAQQKLITGGSDGQLVLWSGLDSQDPKHVVLSGHTAPINDLDGLEISDTKSFIVSLDSEGNLRTWQLLADTWNCVHHITTPHRQLSLCCALSTLPGDDLIPVLALGSADSRVNIHVMEPDQNTFKPTLSLRGHLDWVGGMQFSNEVNLQKTKSGEQAKEDNAKWCCFPDNVSMLASASKDGKTRLWRFEQVTAEALHDKYSFTLPPRDTSKSAAKLEKWKLGENVFVLRLGNTTWCISFETLLFGHEDWVYSASWHPLVNGKQPQKLVTASMDRTALIWEPDQIHGIWSPVTTMGAFGGQSGLFGQLGYYGAVWGPGGSSVVTHGYVCEFHRWDLDEQGEWKPGQVPTGHAKPVCDLAWHPDGHYFATTSLDQTTRMFIRARGKQQGKDTFFELSRAQIHGYDLNCVCFVPRGDKKTHCLASGAEEKVVRVFEAPITFMQNCKALCDGLYSELLDELTKEGATVVVGAALPTLGLSNRAVGVGEDPAMVVKNVREDIGSGDDFASQGIAPTEIVSILDRPPLEECLLQSTLWPERMKLYGHQNEIVCVTATTDGRHLASACKAQKANQAALIIWDGAGLQQLCALSGHGLTVTQLAYGGPGDSRLISVSRDRHVIVWNATTMPYTMIQTVPAHSRIIWGCHWAPQGLPFFATVARDGFLKIWRDNTINNKDLLDSESTEKVVVGCEMKLEEECTAVGFCGAKDCTALVEGDDGQQDKKSGLLLVVGCGSGAVHLLLLCADDKECRLYKVLQKVEGHVDAVKRVGFCPLVEPCGTQRVVQLATCSTDGSVRVFNVLC